MEAIETPKLYRSRKTNHWFFKIKTGAGWKNIAVPVSLAHDREQAQLWASQWATSGAPPVQVLKTFRTLAHLYVEVERSHSPQRAKDAERMLRLYVLPHQIADIPLEKLNVPDCSKWIEWLKLQKSGRTGRAYAPNSVRNFVGGLRQFVTCARGFGWADMLSNPLKDDFLNRVKPVARNVADEPLVLSREQAKCLIESSVELLWIFGIGTGLRAGEMRALRWSDIQDGWVTVTKQEQLGAIKKPKKNSKRRVPLSSQLQSRLIRGEDNDLVFRNRGSWSRLIRAALTRAGLPNNVNGHLITFHSCRRTFATLLVQAGVEIHVIQHLLGQAAGNVTARHYVRMDEGRLRDAVEKLVL